MASLRHVMRHRRRRRRRREREGIMRGGDRCVGISWCASRGPLGGSVEASWGCFGVIGIFLGPLGTLLGAPWGLVGASWGLMGLSPG
eukprot:5373067-Pyramimonas_sp.AAC.1